MNADQLVTRAKARAFIPNTSSFNTAAILEEINTAQRGLFAEALLKADGEYFTEVIDITLDADGFAILPQEALSITARVLTWVDGSGRESSPMRRIEQGDIGSVNGGSGYSYNAAPTSFALTPDGVQVFGYPSTGQLRCRYSRRPGELVSLAVASVLVITGITPGVSFTSSLNHAGLTTWDGAAIDRTRNQSPYRRYPLSGTITHSGVLNVWLYTGTDIAIGDILTFPGTAYLPNAPVEWHDLLVLYSAAALAGNRKDYALKDRLLEEARTLLGRLLTMAQPRTKQNPKVLSAWAGRTAGSRGPG